ncbi:putative mitochondrial DNA topoisomerase II [Trypanosoma theileri]|uniref:Putative mitochondrial DNA topoisomerase II n=1 Tax=Trypanosoma theileri TaxID=67003 RepID=A0A1X0NZ85_9TRYP|nr:putative mitochondrial DNA topoisomerase II [Trypanosoma theileri]ORC89858.1 putative mitochondrial DNA topoisomerase II [Trypanosoma theileri]
MLRRVRLLYSPLDELIITGSRWSRLLAKPVSNGSTSSSTSSSSLTKTPFITLIPTLHVASLQFYDKVLDYMVKAVKERDNVVILLEGICDDEDVEVQQMEEYFQISHNADLRTALLKKADTNTLYTEETMRVICEELAVRYDALKEAAATVRLQECYLRPKMAALVGAHLRNDADLNMREVLAILREENSSDEKNADMTIDIPVSQLGAQPAVRQKREAKVARAAQQRCVEWARLGCGGEVILPWGFYHAEAIRHNILAMNAKDDNVVFVESDETLCRVPFGVTRELLECADSKPAPK